MKNKAANIILASDINSNHCTLRLSIPLVDYPGSDLEQQLKKLHSIVQQYGLLATFLLFCDIAY